MNYVDVFIGLTVGLAFLKGFVSGVWKSITNLLTTILSLFLAYWLAGPAVRFLDAKYGVLTSVAGWIKNVLPALPGMFEPYDPATFGVLSGGLNPAGWTGVFRDYLSGDLAGAASLAGPSPAWVDVLAAAASHLFLSGISFLVLLAVFSALGKLLTRTLSFALPVSLGARVLGGLIETALSVLWLSILAGTLYPTIVGGFLRGINPAASASWLMSLLLGIYRSVWPVLVAKIKF